MSTFGCISIQRRSPIWTIFTRLNRVDGSELLKAIRDKFNKPRSVAIYLVRMLQKDGLLDISFEFGLKGYSSASSVLEGVRKKIQKNRQLRKRLEEIKNSVNIGQTET